MENPLQTENNETEDVTIEDVEATLDDILSRVNILDYVSDQPLLQKDGSFRDFSAEEIKNFSLFVFKIDVSEIKITYSETGERALLSATGINHLFNLRCSATVEQPCAVLKRDKDTGESSLSPIKNWVERGTARIIRNCRKHLIPLEMLSRKIIEFQESFQIDEARARKNAIAKVSSVWDSAQDRIKLLDKLDCLNAAAEIYGDSADWDSKTWLLFADDLRNFEHNYLQTLVSEKSMETEPEPAPETEVEDEPENVTEDTAETEPEEGVSGTRKPGPVNPPDF